MTELDANASAITYWVKQSDGWHVVTTIDLVIGRDTDAEKHAVVRFSSVSLPGQSQLISVPFAIGEQQQVLRIRRLGDQMGSVTPRAIDAGGGTRSAFLELPLNRGPIAMHCVACGSAAVTERPELTAQRYRRFRCQDCGRQFNERSDGILNRASLPSDVIAFVVFCRLRYRLTPRDLSETTPSRGFTVSHESIRRWEAKLLPIMGEGLRKRRHGTGREVWGRVGYR